MYITIPSKNTKKSVFITNNIEIANNEELDEY